MGDRLRAGVKQLT